MSTMAGERPSTMAMPIPVAVVPAGEVEPRIRATEAELEALRHALSTAIEEAVAWENAAGAQFDPDAHQFVAIRLQRFLDDLRAEANGDIASLIAAADARASRRTVTFTWEGLFSERGGIGDPVVVDGQGAAPAPPVAIPEVAPVGPVADADATPEDPPVVTVIPPPAPPLVDVVAVSDEDLINKTLESEFWSDAAQEGFVGHALRVTRTVALQAVAVLLVLVAVLIRIG